jgi:hypothetical protein
MKIIRQGIVGSLYVGVWTCQHCGCKWSMDASDPQPARINDQRDGDAFHMPCPTCKKEVYRGIPRSQEFYR